MTFPYFLCIGAQKAGTTWLHRNARYHPDVWMPPVKEIHYFDDPLKLPLILSVYHPRIFASQKNTIKRLRKYKTLKQRGQLGWFLRFLLFPRNDKWYESLFAPGNGKITGDITPDYAYMSENRIAHVHTCMPDAKIIYLLRNPIHQAWSRATMHLRFWRKRGSNEAQIKQIEVYLNNKKHFGHSNYLANIALWGQYFPRSQMFIDFFDRLVQNPHQFLERIYQFLDLDASQQFIPETVNENPNPGQYLAMPDHIASYLAGQHYELIQQLHQHFDNEYTTDWLDSAHKLLGE